MTDIRQTHQWSKTITKRSGKSRISSSPTSLAYRSNSCLFLSPCLCQKKRCHCRIKPIVNYLTWYQILWKVFDNARFALQIIKSSNHFHFGCYLTHSKALKVRKVTPESPTPHGTFCTGSQLLQSWVIWDVKQNSNIDWSGTTKSNTWISLKAFSNGGGVPKKRPLSITTYKWGQASFDIFQCDLCCTLLSLSSIKRSTCTCFLPSFSEWSLVNSSCQYPLWTQWISLSKNDAKKKIHNS